MTMVHQSRKVVEDYVLYKIKQHIDVTDGLNSVQNQSQSCSEQEDCSQFPWPQDPPSEVNSAVRKVARNYEERYKKVYPDLLDGIRANHIVSCGVDKVFSKITEDLFQVQPSASSRHHSKTSSPSGSRKSKTPSPTLSDHEPNENLDGAFDDDHVKWGHVIGLLVFTGILAVRCVEVNDNERVDQIVIWVSRFLDSRLGSWLRRHGGWNGFAEWCKNNDTAVANWFDQYQIGQRMRTALKVGGAVAALALGAAMLTRK